MSACMHSFDVADRAPGMPQGMAGEASDAKKRERTLRKNSSDVKRIKVDRRSRRVEADTNGKFRLNHTGTF